MYYNIKVLSLPSKEPQTFFHHTQTRLLVSPSILYYVCSYLDSAPALLLEQHVLRLHVAVDDLVPVEQVQALQQRVRELAHQLQREALELVLLDELVQVYAEQLEGEAGVAAEGEVVVQVDDVVRVVFVLLAQVLQYADLLLRLPVEALLVSHLRQREREVDSTRS